MASTRPEEPGDRIPDEGLAPEALASLLRAASGGDELAWGRLVAAYLPRVFAMARSRCRSFDVAEEIAQSVFVTVASKLPSGGYEEQGKFEPWLFRVTMNRVRDEMRRQRRHADPTDPLAFAEREDGGDVRGGRGDGGEGAGPSELEGLRSALAMLSDDDRGVIELRHHGGLSFKQIAEVLGEPLGTVLARHHRALKKVRQLIEDGQAAGRPGHARGGDEG